MLYPIGLTPLPPIIFGLLHMASIARKNLFEDIPRFIVAQAGIMFAVSLVTIQLGILKGFTRSTALLIDYSSADLWIASEEMVHLELTSTMPAERVVEARQVPGVARSEALLIRSSIWRDRNGRIAPIRIFGFNPESQMFARWPLTQGKLPDLQQPYTVVVDQASFKNLGLTQIGDRSKIGSLPAQLVGVTRDTQSIASSAFIFTSLENANAFSTAGLNTSVNCKVQDGELIGCTNAFDNQPDSAQTAAPPAPRRLHLADPISYVLIQAEAGQDLSQLKQRLQERLPKTRVYTQAEIAKITRTYWSERTGVGFILGLGATVGFIVGMVIVGQILYASVADHMREFGTLKAMGASNWVIYRVIVEQALWMAVLGYLPSMIFCLSLGAWTQTAQNVMILIEPTTAVGVFILTIVMCVGSALFSVQKVTRVDPAIVFKA
jgi:putative ABC transport system permease protein